MDFSAFFPPSQYVTENVVVGLVAAGAILGAAALLFRTGGFRDIELDDVSRQVFAGASMPAMILAAIAALGDLKLFENVVSVRIFVFIAALAFLIGSVKRVFYAD